MNRAVSCLILFHAGIGLVRAADYYVATNGNDGATGNIGAPFATIQHAAGVMGPGDTCHVRGGRYREEVVLVNLAGTAPNPYTFRSYNQEEVVIDGTVPITGPWTTTNLNGHSVWVTTVTNDIWQLFVDDRMQVVARWPNVTVGHPCDPIQLKSDGYTPVENTWWDIGTWGQMLSSWNAGGNLTNNAAVHDLAAEGVSFAGGSIVLNFHSESQFSRNILSHAAGSDMLVHEPVVNPHDKGSGPFLIEHLNALDLPGEWYYDSNTGLVWFWPVGGADPNTLAIRGKTISYGLTMTGCSHIAFENIDFFACSVEAPAQSYFTFDDCRFSYPTWFARVLGEHTYNVVNGESRMLPLGEGTTRLGDGAYHTIKNCIFEYSDALIDMDDGYGNVVDNNLFHHWSFSGMASFMLNMNSNHESVQRRNTFHTNGSKVASKHSRADVEYSRAYWFGYFQADGTAWQCKGGSGPGEGSDGVRRHHNWHHDALKTGGRWDGSNGINGTNDHMVSWNATSSLMVKGDYHSTHNNTAIFAHDPTDNMIKVLDDNGGDPPEERNTNSHTYNNLTDSLSADRSGYTPLNGFTNSNWNGYMHPDPADTADEQLRDPRNLDFRPKAGSDLVDAGVVVPGITDGYIGGAPDIGAYEFNDTHYWIPGYRTVEAGTPVPPDGSTTVRPDADLMWLEGRDVLSHNVYLGTNSGSLAFMTNQASNIFEPGDLVADRTYVWRIDTVTATGTVIGAEWSFAPRDPVETAFITFNPVADTYARHADDNPGYADTNYGTNDSVAVANYPDGSILKHGYIRFDINLTGTVVGATLKLHNSSGGTVNDLGIYAMTNTSWGETTLTWNNRPAIDGSLLDKKDILGGGNWSSFTVTDAITGTGLVSFGLIKDLGLGQRSVDSRESAWVPELVVEFEPQADAPPATPQNLVATGEVGRIRLNWDDNVEPDLAGYHLYRTDYLDDDFVRINPSILTNSTYVDVQVVPGTNYYYKVRAVDLLDQLSPGSLYANAAALDAPVLSITVSNGQAVVSWEPVVGTLQSAPAVTGSWGSASTSSPYVEGSGSDSQFYRVVP